MQLDDRLNWNFLETYKLYISIKLSIEHGLQLQKFTYMWIFVNKYI